MNLKTLLWLALAGALLAFTAPAFSAEKMYKWVDAEGNIHFSDRPPDDSSEAEQIEVDAEISAERRREGQQRLQETQSAMAQRRLDELSSTEAQAQRTAERDRQQFQNQVRCAEARGNLAVLERQGPVFTMNEQGERVFVEDANRDQEIAKYRRAVNQYCQQEQP